jgi:RNA polymerase sigma-70 factor (sigma-E family)
VEASFEYVRAADEPIVEPVGAVCQPDFEHFVTTRGKALLRFAVVLCGDRGRAEDLVQSSLLSVYPRWDKVAAMERPEAYVRTAIVREHLRWWRRRSSWEIPAVIAEEDEPTHSDQAQTYVSRDAAWELLGRLPRRQRAVLVLRYYADMADDEIAAALGCRPSTVRSQATRGLAALRDFYSHSVRSDSHGVWTNSVNPVIDREALP